MKSKAKGFTLIELLIVVAIIGILAAIAMTNYLNAQIRAKVSRVKAEMRSIDLALELYAVDHNVYPPAYTGTPLKELSPVTTPIDYITSLPYDIFSPRRHPNYEYVLYRFELEGGLFDDTPADPARGGNEPMMCFMMQAPIGRATNKHGWFLFSWGPDRDEEYNYAGRKPRCLNHKYYDPTNGTISSGDIYRVQSNATLY